MTNQYPYRYNTTQGTASEDDSRYETPGGAANKIEQALEDAKEYTDAEMVSYVAQTVNLADDAVTRPKIAPGAVGATELDPSLLDYTTDIAVAAKFDEVDAQLAETETQLSLKASQASLNATNVAKADRSYVDAQIANVAGGAPDETFATLTLLQSAYPTGSAKNKLVSADGHIYNWNGSAWTDTGIQYQATGIADYAVSYKKTDFVVTGKNLLNPAACTSGFYVNNVTGALTANADKTSSDYLNVVEGVQYAQSGDVTARAAFYNSAKVFISGVSPLTNPISIPAGAKFIRFSVDTNKLGATQFEVGAAPSTYEPYGNKFAQQLPAAESSIHYKQTDFVVTGKNLFNKATVNPGNYINYLNGDLAANALYSASDFIPVAPSAQYKRSFEHQMAFYTAGKVYISGINAGIAGPITTPSNCAYIRVTALTAAIDTMQVEKNTVTTAYEPFGLRFVTPLPDETVYAGDSISVFLPSEICVAVGRTIELYDNQVAFCGNIQNFHFQWDCEVGKSLKRKFSVTGTSAAIGNHTLTLTVYDNNRVSVASAVTTVKIVSATIGTARSILTIGDSLTNNKAWLGELRTLSGNQYTLVGTRGTSPLKHEGRSGFSAGNYLTATEYTFESEGVHPFWDGTRFNWNYYKTQTGMNPDVVQVYLGTNGIALDPTVNAGNIKQIVDYIRQDDALIHIYLVFTLFRGNQDGLGVQTSVDGYSVNRGAWKLQEDAKVFNLMVKLSTLLSGYTNLHFVPISLCHDSEFNFGAVSTPVNPRASQTELLPVEATHPQSQGYMQMADIMFSTFAAH